MQTYEQVKSVLLIAPEPALVLEARQALSGVRCPGKATLVREYPSAVQLSTLVRDKNPALVLVSMHDAARALSVIEALAAKGPVVVAIVSGDDPEQAEAAAHAGAAVVVETPLEAVRLEQILRQVPARPAGDPGRRSLSRRVVGLAEAPHTRRRRKRRKRGGREVAPTNGSPSYAPTLMAGPIAASPDTPPAA